MLTMRFDMRVPDWAGVGGTYYSAVLDMCEWAETRGAALSVLSEHHGADDGHLPTPLILASAVAARTQEMAILLAAVPLPLWDPVRLAEEINVLDLISGGRVSYAFGVGHREEEYTHFGIDMAARGQLADEYLRVLIALVHGESIEFRGRRVRVTPRCVSAGGPPMMIACGSKAAVRRAATHGLGFISQVDRPELRTYYEAQCRTLGKVPGFVQFPVPDSPTAVFVADNVDQAWEQLGPHLLHDAAMAASYRHGRRLGGQHYPGDDRGRAAPGRRTVPHPDTHGGNGIRPRWEVASVASTVRRHRTRRGVALSADGGGGPSASPDGPRMSKEEAATDPIRVVVWSTGGVGSVAVDAVLNSPQHGTRCAMGSFTREGREGMLGELAGTEPIGVVGHERR